MSPSWCRLVRSDLDRRSMILGEMVANAGDTGPAGDKPRQRRVIRTRRITIDHGLAIDNLQQSSVVDLSTRWVPDKEGAESKFRRHIAVFPMPHSPRSRHGEQSKAGEPVSITKCPSRRRRPTDRGNGMTRHGTQPGGHGRQHTPEPASRLRDAGRRARVGCGSRCRPPTKTTAGRTQPTRRSSTGCTHASSSRPQDGSSAPVCRRPHGHDRRDGPWCPSIEAQFARLWSQRPRNRRVGRRLDSAVDADPGQSSPRLWCPGW